MKDLFCRPRLQLSEGELELVAYGEVARGFAQAHVGQPVEVEGVLVIHQWRTGEGVLRQRIEIRATKVRLGRRRPGSNGQP